MIRLVVKFDFALPVGDWPSTTEYLTFDVEATEVEAFLKTPCSYGAKAIVGGHVVEPAAGEEKRDG